MASLKAAVAPVPVTHAGSVPACGWADSRRSVTGWPACALLLNRAAGMAGPKPGRPICGGGGGRGAEERRGDDFDLCDGGWVRSSGWRLGGRRRRAGIRCGGGGGGADGCVRPAPYVDAPLVLKFGSRYFVGCFCIFTCKASNSSTRVPLSKHWLMLLWAAASGVFDGVVHDIGTMLPFPSPMRLNERAPVQAIGFRERQTGC